MNLRRAVSGMLTVIFLSTALAANALAQSGGKADFEHNCASCHGADGKGHGPALYVIPQVKPPDLTLLSQRNGGKFPADAVYRTIDGRDTLPSHKRFDMPFWGVRFQEQGNAFTPESEAKVKQRLSDLVAYIQSLQQK